MYGVGPLGFAVIMSPRDVLTCYFPEKASARGLSDLCRFANAVNKVAKKALWLKKQRGEEIREQDHMKFPSSEVPFFLSKNRFASFLERYRKIDDTGHMAEDVKKLLKEEGS